MFSVERDRKEICTEAKDRLAGVFSACSEPQKEEPISSCMKSGFHRAKCVTVPSLTEPCRLITSWISFVPDP